MAVQGVPKRDGKGIEVNGEGAEKVAGTSTTKSELTTNTIQDVNPKVAGLSNGKRMADIKAKLPSIQ